MKCGKCGNEWDYKGSATRISCSKCKTSITIAPQSESRRFGIDDTLNVPNLSLQIPVKHVTTEVKFPPSLWKDVRLAQRFYGLKATGDDYVVLKVDEQGILSLP